MSVIALVVYYYISITLVSILVFYYDYYISTNIISLVLHLHGHS